MKKLVDEMLRLSTRATLNKFGALPGAIVRRSRKGDGYVFVPGALPHSHRALLVAHADTVASGPGVPVWSGDVVTSGSRGPLGADDRAGCSVLWTLRKSGHSLLVTDGEESGGRGVRNACSRIGKHLSAHQCAFQIDRRGDKEIAVYTGATSSDWEGWIESSFPGWSIVAGSYTDIATIGDVLGICGANLAAGYVHEHTSHETLYMGALERTRKALARVLKEGAPLLPNFPTERPRYTSKGKGWLSEWWTEPAPRTSTELDDCILLDRAGNVVGSASDVPPSLWIDIGDPVAYKAEYEMWKATGELPW